MTARSGFGLTVAIDVVGGSRQESFSSPAGRTHYPIQEDGTRAAIAALPRLFNVVRMFGKAVRYGFATGQAASGDLLAKAEPNDFAQSREPAPVHPRRTPQCRAVRWSLDLPRKTPEVQQR